jgi:hypothetical protein
MLEYNTTGTVRINGGVIGLSKKQADARRACVRPVKEKAGLYNVIRPIEFKVGETVRLDNPDKALMQRLALTPAEQAKQAEQAKVQEQQAKQSAEAALEEAASKAERRAVIKMAARQAMESGAVTTAGAPRVEAIEEIAGFDIAADERDEVWQQIQAEID